MMTSALRLTFFGGLASLAFMIVLGCNPADKNIDNATGDRDPAAGMELDLTPPTVAVESESSSETEPPADESDADPATDEASTDEASTESDTPTDETVGDAADESQSSAAQVEADRDATPNAEAAAKSSPTEDTNWKSLFDGKSLDGWKLTKFGGEGEVTVEDGALRLDYGQPMTGITYAGEELPTNNYEIELEAQRVDGFDFFCCLTFPFNETHASLVLGGWGGSVVGISSIDDMDASENDTTEYITFENKKWHKVRLRVTPSVLQAWIGDKVIVNENIEGKRLSTRIEVDPSKPLGLSCFDCIAAYRNIQIRPLGPDEGPIDYSPTAE